MPQKAHVLIVDDETAISSMLEEFFCMQGYRTTVANSGREALAAVGAAADRADPVDVILLDVNMPDMDGFTVCRRLREYVTCPIIFLTARVEDVDQLDGFSAGADDYVLKPFSLRVLAGRVQAHLAREERRMRDRELSVRFFGDVTIDYGQRVVDVRAVARNGKKDCSQRLDLTRIEFDIIALLSKSPGRVFDRDVIYERVWGWDAEGDSSLVREHVRRVRKKFADAGVGEDPIQTVWGVGYKWRAQ